MTGSIVFINLAGAVALLLWATRMVRTGIERAYGNVLRDKLRSAIGNRVSAAIAGFFLAIALQSATAVALIVSGFVAGGYVSSAIGIATLLGADFGSAFVVRLLRHDLSLLIPILLLAGTISFRATQARDWRQAGRIFFGLGLLLLSLKMIGDASQPLKSSELLPVVISYLSRDFITAFLLAAIVAWLFHSSVATILLFASLCDRELVPVILVVPLVLGANFGAAMIAAVLTRGADDVARIVPLGNVVIRGFATLFALVLHLFFPFPVETITQNPGDAVVYFHLILNGVVAIVGLLFSGAVASFLQAVVIKPAPVSPVQQYRFSALQPQHLSNPKQAINNATREVITLCDKIDLMLVQIFDVLETENPERMSGIEILDDEIDNVHREIKFYLAKISENLLDEHSAARCQDLLSATIKLEQAADIMSQNMLIRAKKKHDRGTKFSTEGWAELSALHDEVLKNARLAFNLLVNQDVEHARQLVAQKELVRNMTQRSEEMHLRRLRDGNMASFDSSSLHIDMMRDLKEINSLVVSIAYPVLAKAGMLRESRLL